MKQGVVIINTARGAVMDEASLVEALDSGKVSSAGLDVFEEEPNVHPGLLANPRVLLVPHMGTWTVETETKMEEWYVSKQCPTRTLLTDDTGPLVTSGWRLERGGYEALFLSNDKPEIRHDWWEEWRRRKVLP